MLKHTINDDIEIFYNECDQKYISNIISYFNLYNKDVMNFFKISKMDKKVIIKLWDDSDIFREELKIITGNDMPFWATGSSKNDRNDEYSRIDYLSLKEIKKIDYHKDETVADLKKGILHEFVHTCHSQSCNYNYPNEYFLTEGVATYLAHQYDNCKLNVPIKKILDDVDYVEYENYRFLFNKLVEFYSHDDLLDILNNKNKLDYDKLINFMNKLNK